MTNKTYNNLFWLIIMKLNDGGYGLCFLLQRCKKYIKNDQEVFKFYTYCHRFAIMLSAVLLNVIVVTIITIKIIMLSVVFVESH